MPSASAAADADVDAAANGTMSRLRRLDDLARHDQLERLAGARCADLIAGMAELIGDCGLEQPHIRTIAAVDGDRAMAECRDGGSGSGEGLDLNLAFARIAGAGRLQIPR